MSEIEAFKTRVETFLAERGWTPTKFGKTAAKDPLFVFQLRQGREPRFATRQRVEEFMLTEAASADRQAAEVAA